MYLRYLITYNENGVNSSTELQCWNEKIKRWQDVIVIRCREADEESYMTQPPDCYY